jgi:hypothetical protein
MNRKNNGPQFSIKYMLKDEIEKNIRLEKKK